MKPGLREGTGINPKGREELAGAEGEGLRAGLYALLSHLLIKPADAAMLARLRQLDSADGALGQAIGALAASAIEASPEAVEDEYSLLFYGMGQGGEVLPYASYYLTGNLHDRPLAELRREMERLGIAHGGLDREPEDHIAYLFEIMHGLISGRFPAGSLSVAEQRRFFDAHVASWAVDFFEDLEAAGSARLYAVVGRIGRLFMELERDAFQMAA